MAGEPAEIWTEQIPNTNLEGYRYSNQLGVFM
jgi:hypothetical protein